MGDEQLKRDLAGVFNIHGTDNDANTPDHILAEIAFDAIRSFRQNAKRRDDWRGVPPWSPGQLVTVSEPSVLRGDALDGE